MLDDGGGIDDGMIADDREGMNDGCGADVDTLAERGRGVNDGGGVNKGRGEEVRARSNAVEQAAATLEVAERENRLCVAGVGEIVVEDPEPWEMEESSGHRLGMVIVKPDNAEACQHCGLGDDEGVAPAAQHDDRIGHRDTIGRAAGSGCN